MMKIAVVGANGKAGQWIVKEALRQGLDVTAVIRHANKSDAKSVLKRTCSPSRRIIWPGSTPSSTPSARGRRKRCLSIPRR